MPDALAGLEPEPVWEHFSAIASIPRPSKHEQRIAAWVREYADRHGFPLNADAVGNLVIDVPATEGREKAPVVVLQSHLDMVCEKNNDVDHDFFRDPIRPQLQGEWIRASGTTLGADNGIGLAALLAVAVEPGTIHGPLQLLCTVDEETGLTGAQQLDPKLIRGQILLNLDSEEDGVLFIGCAGGADTHLRLSPALVAPRKGGTARVLSVRGLRGGHSGMNIHERRGNALKLAARVLGRVTSAGLAFELAALEGGSMHNAIPREAEATIVLPEKRASRLAEIVERAAADFRAELAGGGEGLALHVEKAPLPDQVLDEASARRLLALVRVLPHGVAAMSAEIPGLVETSSNLAVVRRDESGLQVIASSRSSIDSALEEVLATIAAAGELAGAEIETHDGYPGWQPDLDSRVLAVAREVYTEIWDGAPKVTAIHAGLECGLLGRKLPGLDMISFGPQIEGAHSPDERVHVPSVQRFWKALRAILGRLAAVQA